MKLDTISEELEAYNVTSLVEGLHAASHEAHRVLSCSYNQFTFIVTETVNQRRRQAFTISPPIFINPHLSCCGKPNPFRSSKSIPNQMPRRTCQCHIRCAYACFTYANTTHREHSDSHSAVSLSSETCTIPTRQAILCQQHEVTKSTTIGSLTQRREHR